MMIMIVSFILAFIVVIALMVFFEITSTYIMYLLVTYVMVGLMTVFLKLKKVLTWRNPLSRLQAFGDGIYQAMLNMHMLSC